MLRRLYDWCVNAAGKPYAAWVLGAVSFAESSFFPVPPDIMLIPMSLARPDRAWYFATICTLTSVGYGEIYPVHPIARSLAMFEALLGQLYPAILIAALVGMALQSHSQKETS